MLPEVMFAYGEEGFRIDLGNPSRVYSTLIDRSGKRSLSVSGGLTVTDAFVFSQIGRLFSPESIFVIGNSFGLSTFVLAELFPSALVDAIDGEVEGLDVAQGTELTRRIARRHFPNVQVTVGYSPQDIDKARRCDSYGLVFVDGLHTNEQMLKDYQGMLPFAAEECVFVFHDVGYANMQEAWTTILETSRWFGFSGFPLGYTQLGTCVLARGRPELLRYLGNLSNEFSGTYRATADDTDGISYQHRPFFWDLSFGHLERLVQRKIKTWRGSVRHAVNAK